MPRDANGNFTPVHNFTTEYNAGQKTIRADYMDEQFTDLATAIVSDTTTGARNSALVRRNASGKIFGDILGNAATATLATNATNATNATTAAACSGNAATATDLADGSILSISKGGTNASNAGAALTNLGVSSFAQTLLDDANAGAARTTMGLNALSSLSLAADKILYIDHAGAPQLLSLGDSGTFLKSQGTTSAPAFAVPGGGVGAVIAATRSMTAADGAVDYSTSETTKTPVGAFIHAQLGSDGNVSFSDGYSDGSYGSCMAKLYSDGLNSYTSYAVFCSQGSGLSQSVIVGGVSFSQGKVTLTWNRVGTTTTGTINIRIIPVY